MYTPQDVKALARQQGVSIKRTWLALCAPLIAKEPNAHMRNKAWRVAALLFPEFDLIYPQSLRPVLYHSFTKKIEWKQLQFTFGVTRAYLASSLLLAAERYLPAHPQYPNLPIKELYLYLITFGGADPSLRPRMLKTGRFMPSTLTLSRAPTPTTQPRKTPYRLDMPRHKAELLAARTARALVVARLLREHPDAKLTELLSPMATRPVDPRALNLYLKQTQHIPGLNPETKAFLQSFVTNQE